MKKYDDYKDIKDVEWTKYKIIVPTEADRQELMAAFEHIHYSDIDTEYIAVNQLAHEYLDDSRVEGSYNNIIVNPELFKSI